MKRIRTALLAAALLVCGSSLAQAAIQYAGGTNVNAQCTATAGTKQELSDCIEDNLTTAGWTVVSGSHTTSVLMQSAATPASLQMRLALTQGTNCVNLKGRNVGNTKAAATGQFLLPAVSKVFRVIANKYQYFVSTDGTPAARSAVMGGVLYVPSFTSLTEAIWTMGNSDSDSDTATVPTFKSCLAPGYGTTCGVNTGNTINYWMTVNGTQVESTGQGTNNTQIGVPSFMMTIPANLGASNAPSGSYVRWFDNSYFISEPLMAWCPTSPISCESKIMGQVWDGALINTTIASEQSLTFDSHNWLTFTNNGTGVAGGLWQGVLVLVVP